MLRKNLQKQLALVLAATLLATTFAGCGQTEKSSTPSSSKTEESSKTAESSSTPESSSEAEDEIKWSGTITVHHHTPGPVGEHDDMLAITEFEKALLEKYGYDVRIEPVYFDASDLGNQYNLRLMSGDMTDVFGIHGLSTWETWIEDGLVATWSEEFFREHAPNVAAFFDAGGYNGTAADEAEMIWEVVKDDEGNMAGIPVMNNVIACENILTYNKVWLDNLGLDVPTTLDEFYDVAYAFTYDDPDQDGKDDTYGFSSSVFDFIFGAHGSWPGMYLTWSIWVDDGEGGIVKSDIAPGNKEALAFLAKCYADGLIDPEWVTRENAVSNNPTQPFLNQVIGITACGNAWHWAAPQPEFNDLGGAYYQNYMAANPDGQIEFGPHIMGPDGQYGAFQLNSYTAMQGVAINASVMDEPGKLEAIFAIMDICAQDLDMAIMGRAGVEGVHWDMTASGGYARRAEFSSGTDQCLNGIGMVRGLVGAGMAYNQELGDMETNTPIKYWAKKYVFSRGEQYVNGYADKLLITLPSAGDYNPATDAARGETWTKIILGDLPLDAYDDYVEDYLAKGGQVLLDEANEWYKGN